MAELEDGADPNQPIAGHHSPLWSVVANGDPQIIDALISAKAKTDEFDSFYGLTPLMLASARGDISAVDVLVNSGARVNIQDRATEPFNTVLTGTGDIRWPGQRLTPLMAAAGFDYRDVVKLLLASGADAKIRNAAGLTAAEMALSRNYRDVHDLILESLRPSVERPPEQIGKDVSPAAMISLHNAIVADDVDRVRQWLRTPNKTGTGSRGRSENAA